jgi:hypothetical protein
MPPLTGIPLISFCTTCMGRLKHLKCTMPENMLAASRQDVEFVILNYSSPDECEEWIRETFRQEMRSGTVVYYRFDGATYFHHAHAKNLSHRLARGAIVCNLDADNYIGEGFVEYLLNIFQAKPNGFMRAVRGQVYGRMAFRKTDFLKLGGYDERMKGWGAEDLDLAGRAKAFGLTEVVITDPAFLRYIHHGNAERVRLLPVKNTLASDRRHRRMSARSIARGKLVANLGLPWGAGNVTQIPPDNLIPPAFSCKSHP